jgi:hypothetical protein
MDVDVHEVADWCRRWHEARERYLKALKEPKPEPEIHELRNWEDRYRIAFQNAFHAHFGRFPAPGDCDGGRLEKPNA